MRRYTVVKKFIKFFYGDTTMIKFKVLWFFLLRYKGNEASCFKLDYFGVICSKIVGGMRASQIYELQRIEL